MGAEPEFPSREKPGLLFRAQRIGGFTQAGPRLHLDEGEQAGFLGDQIDLARRGPLALGKNDPALLDQGLPRDILRMLTGAVGYCAALAPIWRCLSQRAPR